MPRSQREEDRDAELRGWVETCLDLLDTAIKSLEDTGCITWDSLAAMDIGDFLDGSSTPLTCWRFRAMRPDVKTRFTSTTTRFTQLLNEAFKHRRRMRGLAEARSLFKKYKRLVERCEGTKMPEGGRTAKRLSDEEDSTPGGAHRVAEVSLGSDVPAAKVAAAADSATATGRSASSSPSAAGCKRRRSDTLFQCPNGDSSDTLFHGTPLLSGDSITVESFIEQFLDGTQVGTCRQSLGLDLTDPQRALLYRYFTMLNDKLTVMYEQGKERKGSEGRRDTTTNNRLALEIARLRWRSVILHRVHRGLPYTSDELFEERGHGRCVLLDLAYAYAPFECTVPPLDETLMKDIGDDINGMNSSSVSFTFSQGLGFIAGMKEAIDACVACDRKKEDIKRDLFHSQVERTARGMPTENQALNEQRLDYEGYFPAKRYCKNIPSAGRPKVR